MHARSCSGGNAVVTAAGRSTLNQPERIIKLLSSFSCSPYRSDCVVRRNDIRFSAETTPIARVPTPNSRNRHFSAHAADVYVHDSSCTQSCMIADLSLS